MKFLFLSITLFVIQSTEAQVSASNYIAATSVKLQIKGDSVLVGNKYQHVFSLTGEDSRAYVLDGVVVSDSVFMNLNEGACINIKRA